MTDDPTESTAAHSLVRALLTPLRTSQHVIGNIETIATALVSLQRDTQERLASVDEHIGALLAPLVRLDRRVTELQKLERTLTEQTDLIREEMNARMKAVEGEVRAMRSPIERVCRDVTTVAELLPNPADGPFARFKHTFTPNGAPPRQPPSRPVRRA